jgi:hypothetical protein
MFEECKSNFCVLLTACYLARTEPGIGLRASAIADTLPFDNALVATEVFPEGELDADLQQVDLRKQIVGA